MRFAPVGGPAKRGPRRSVAAKHGESRLIERDFARVRAKPPPGPTNGTRIASSIRPDGFCVLPLLPSERDETTMFAIPNATRFFAAIGLAAVVCAFAAPAARAGVVYGNLGASGTNTAGTGSNADQAPTAFNAQGFTTGTTNLTLLSASVFGRSGSVANTFSMSLWSAVSGNPGSILAESLTKTVSSTNALQEFVFSPGYVLSPNTTYFVGFGAVPADQLMRWRTINSATPTEQNGSGYAFLGSRHYDGATWSDGGANDLSVSINAVPEPQTVALLGAGGAAMAAGLLRRRRAGRR